MTGNGGGEKKQQKKREEAEVTFDLLHRRIRSWGTKSSPGEMRRVKRFLSGAFEGPCQPRREECQQTRKSNLLQGGRKKKPIEGGRGIMKGEKSKNGRLDQSWGRGTVTRE